MTAPIATNSELQTFLGLSSTIDTNRADLLLQLAQDRLEMYAYPLPALAKGIELAVAGRAYTNITSARQAGIGSAQMSFGAPASSYGLGGLYISKSEIRDVRRLAGRTGAFSIDLVPAIPPTAVPVVNNVDPDSAATGDLVRVIGYGFTGATAVTFAGTSAEFLVVSDTLIHAVVPAVTGSVSVVVTNAVGASTGYTYTAA